MRPWKGHRRSYKDYALQKHYSEVGILKYLTKLLWSELELDHGLVEDTSFMDRTFDQSGFASRLFLNYKFELSEWYDTNYK